MKFPELSEQGNQDALRLIVRFKSQLQSVAEEAIGEVYCNLLPHIESDAWINYREECRLALEKHYVKNETCTTEEAWARLVRAAIFEQFRPELEQGLILDLQKRVKFLEGLLKERRY